MKKISTLFQKDPNDMGRVISTINPKNAWVVEDAKNVTCSRKFDGTSCAVIGGELYKRYDAKLSRPEITNPVPGMSVVKRSGKPFKNNSKVNKITVTGVVNPYSGKPAVKLQNGEFVDLYILRENRFTLEPVNTIPEGAIPCQDPDEKSGHWPHWIKCDPSKPADKYHFEGWEEGKHMDGTTPFEDGTYELCGPKIQSNPESLTTHILIRHGDYPISEYNVSKQLLDSFDYWKYVIKGLPFEGVVFKHKDGRMCKLRKTDFGFSRK